MRELDDSDVGAVQKSVRALQLKRNGGNPRFDVDDANWVLSKFGIFHAEGRLWRFHRTFNRCDFGMMLASRPDEIPEDRMGIPNRYMNYILLRSESEPSIQYALQLGFDFYTRIGNSWRDREIRARYASLVFAPPESDKAMEDAQQLESASVRMNWGYQRMCGLTYDEIIEPLHKA